MVFRTLNNREFRIFKGSLFEKKRYFSMFDLILYYDEKL